MLWSSLEMVEWYFHIFDFHIATDQMEQKYGTCCAEPCLSPCQRRILAMLTHAFPFHHAIVTLHGHLAVCTIARTLTRLCFCGGLMIGHALPRLKFPVMDSQ